MTRLKTVAIRDFYLLIAMLVIVLCTKSTTEQESMKYISTPDSEALVIASLISEYNQGLEELHALIATLKTQHAAVSSKYMSIPCIKDLTNYIKKLSEYADSNSSIDEVLYTSPNYDNQKRIFDLRQRVEELQAARNRTTEKSISQINPDQVMLTSLSRLSLQVLYQEGYPVVTDILGIVQDVSIQSWSELSDRIQAYISTTLQHCPSNHSFLMDLKNPELYTASTSLVDVLIRLDVDLITLVSERYFLDYSSTCDFLCTLIYTDYTCYVDRTADHLKLSEPFVFINSILLHSILIKGGSNAVVQKMNETLHFRIEEYVRSLKQNDLQALYDMLKPIGCDQSEISAQRKSLVSLIDHKLREIESQKLKSQEILLTHPEDYQAIQEVFMVDQSPYFSELLLYMENILYIYTYFNASTYDNILEPIPSVQPSSHRRFTANPRVN